MTLTTPEFHSTVEIVANDLDDQPESDSAARHAAAIDLCHSSIRHEMTGAPDSGCKITYAAPGNHLHASMIRRPHSVKFDTVHIGGIPTARASRQEFAAKMVSDCMAARAGHLETPQVLTSSNGSVIARFHRDQGFRDLIMSADAVDADGQPLVLASRRFCNLPLQERVATTDFIHDAAKAAVDYKLRFYFLGGKPGVAAAAAALLKELHPGLEVVGVRDGYFAHQDEDAICREVLDLNVDVLWVGMGSPMQESFAIRNKQKLAGVGWIKTCGGLFDHYCGNATRAPMWMQKSGLEWLFRALKEPGRLGPRYLATNLPALYHLITATSDRRNIAQAPQTYLPEMS